MRCAACMLRGTPGGGGRGRGGGLGLGLGLLGLIFAAYVPLACQSPYPIIVYFLANYSGAP